MFLTCISLKFIKFVTNLCLLSPTYIIMVRTLEEAIEFIFLAYQYLVDLLHPELSLCQISMYRATSSGKPVYWPVNKNRKRFPRLLFRSLPALSNLFATFFDHFGWVRTRLKPARLVVPCFSDFQ